MHAEKVVMIEILKSLLSKQTVETWSFLRWSILAKRLIQLITAYFWRDRRTKWAVHSWFTSGSSLILQTGISLSRWIWHFRTVPINYVVYHKGQSWDPFLFFVCLFLSIQFNMAKLLTSTKSVDMCLLMACDCMPVFNLTKQQVI